VIHAADGWGAGEQVAAVEDVYSCGDLCRFGDEAKLFNSLMPKEFRMNGTAPALTALHTRFAFRTREANK